MSNRKRTIIAPLPDVWVDENQFDMAKIVTFHIRNDDPESSITSTMVQFGIDGDTIHEVLIGYFPPLAGEKCRSDYEIGDDTDSQCAGLHKWLGVDRDSYIPRIKHAYTRDLDFEEKLPEYERQNPRESWRLPLDEISPEEKDEIRKGWLDNINAAFREKFAELELNPECQRKSELLLDEIFERIEKRQPINVKSEYIKGLLDSPDRGFRVGGEDLRRP